MKLILIISSLFFLVGQTFAHTDGSLHLHAESTNSHLSLVLTAILLSVAIFTARRVLKKSH